MMVKLKPCPFCGGEALVQAITFGDDYHTDSLPVWWVACAACGVHTDEYEAPTEAEAVAAWNTRVYEGMGTIECYECHNGYPMVRERTCHMTKEQDPDFPDVWWNCSNCHAGVWLEAQVRDLPNYCPNCGAKVVE